MPYEDLFLDSDLYYCSKCSSGTITLSRFLIFLLRVTHAGFSFWGKCVQTSGTSSWIHTDLFLHRKVARAATCSAFSSFALIPCSYACVGQTARTPTSALEVLKVQLTKSDFLNSVVFIIFGMRVDSMELTSKKRAITDSASLLVSLPLPLWSCFFLFSLRGVSDVRPCHVIAIFCQPPLLFLKAVLIHG